MADVFVSYKNTQDRPAIMRRLATALRADGHSVWWDAVSKQAKNLLSGISAN